MNGRWLAWVVVAAAAVVGGAMLAAGDAPPDPLEIVEEWVAARNRGDIAAAMSMIADDGYVLGTPMWVASRRDVLEETFRAQVAAGWQMADFDCAVDDLVVTCRYVQDDRILRSLGLSLTGTHTYIVRAGRIGNVDRIHDEASRDAAYGALEALRTWIAANHPSLEPVIWPSRSAVTYTTIAGAEAMLGVLDQYLSDR